MGRSASTTAAAVPAFSGPYCSYWPATDSGQVAAEQGENKVLASQLRSELDEVERALAKIDVGTYGKCETCGEQIAEARLEAMPATRFCIQHA